MVAINNISLNNNVLTITLTGLVPPQIATFIVNGVSNLTGVFNLTFAGKYLIQIEIDGVIVIQKEIKVAGLCKPKKDFDFTLSYHLSTEKWVSYHNYHPNMFLGIGNNIYAIEQENIHQHNKGGKGLFYNELYPSFIDVVFIFNEKVQIQSVKWFAETTDEYGSPMYENTFSHITMRTLQQTTGKQVILHNATINEYEWLWNACLDKGIKGKRIAKGVLSDYETVTESLFPFKTQDRETPRFNVPYIIIRLETDNIDNLNILLHDISINTIESYR